jgi:predicted metalloprotease with PDZ domain
VLLLRAGLLNGATYLKLLTKPINQVLATPGRHVQSVAQASFDAWVRYYRPDENTANSTVSYYTKGSLLALALDLTLRALPKQSASLDGVMKRLWALQRPIDEADVAQALTDEASVPPPDFKDWASLLNQWVHGTDDLPLSGLLAQAGVQWKPATSTLSQRIGVRLNESPQGLKVSAVMRGSPAEAAGLSAGDELLALDGWRLKRADDWQALAISASLKPLLISRDMRLHTLTLPLLDSGPTAWCQVISLEMEAPAASKASPSKTGKATKPAKPTPSMALRKGWLGC